MHGGTNPGAGRGNRNAWKHGARSGETLQLNRRIHELGQLVRSIGME